MKRCETLTREEVSREFPGALHEMTLDDEGLEFVVVGDVLTAVQDGRVWCWTAVDGWTCEDEPEPEWK